jgi:hypothetical protein
MAKMNTNEASSALDRTTDQKDGNKEIAAMREPTKVRKAETSRTMERHMANSTLNDRHIDGKTHEDHHPAVKAFKEITK